jgi:peptide/nickel transport system substrate-binding protein
VSVRTEPRTFNRLAARDTTTDLVSLLTQARLVRINRVSQEAEPWLAQGWTRSDDGLRYTVKLWPNVSFSDGHPFTADDVVFSFEAVYDQKAGSALADSLKMGGRKLTVTEVDPLTVAVSFPAPFAPGLRILDNLPILPRHKLEAALKAGTFASAWGLSTPPADIVGLGPFVVTQYLPGQRLVLVRNPHYWRKDASGTPLPYLDRLTIDIVPDESAEVLRLESGQIDMTFSSVAPESYAIVKRAADAGRVTLMDLGVAYDADSFWFNLKPGAFAADPRAPWLQRDELRRAISMAVDRQLFADTVFLGAGVPVYGPVTPGNKKWYAAEVPHAPHDPARARELLGSIGLSDRNGDGVLENARHQPARFTLLTQKGRPSLERGAAVIRDELKKVGLVVDVVSLDAGALIQRILSAKYDSVYFDPGATDTDPAINPDFWFSFGDAHLWNMMQKTPATEWEKRIDELMTRQITSPDEAERKRLFDEVQTIFVEHLPVINFVAPRIYVAASSRVTNLTPALSRPQLLWAADTIAVKR